MANKCLLFLVTLTSLPMESYYSSQNSSESEMIDNYAGQQGQIGRILDKLGYVVLLPDKGPMTYDLVAIMSFEKELVRSEAG